MMICRPVTSPTNANAEEVEKLVKYTLATGDCTYQQLIEKIGKANQRDIVELALDKVCELSRHSKRLVFFCSSWQSEWITMRLG
jgi:hypothetical protein